MAETFHTPLKPETTCSRRREEADSFDPPPHVGGYKVCERSAQGGVILSNRAVKSPPVGRANVHPLDYVGLIVIGEYRLPSCKVRRDLYDRVLQG